MEVRAWVGCLSCYNNGHLNGAWVTSQEAQTEQENLLGGELTVGSPYLGGLATLQNYTESDALPHPTCNRCGADEFDIFDTEGIGKVSGYGEFWSAAEEINELLDQEEWGQITEVMVNFGYTLSDLAEARQYHADYFSGSYPSEAEFANQFIDDSVPMELREIEVLGRPILDWIDGQDLWDYTLKYSYWTAPTGAGDIYVWAN